MRDSCHNRGVCSILLFGYDCLIVQYTSSLFTNHDYRILYEVYDIRVLDTQATCKESAEVSLDEYAHVSPSVDMPQSWIVGTREVKRY